MTDAGPAVETSVESPYASMLASARAYAGAFAANPKAGTRELLPSAVTAVLFALLFAQPFVQLAHDWWTLPEAGHGLLLAPVSIWLAFKSGVRDDVRQNPVLGAGILLAAVLLRCVGGLAAELFTTRVSIVLAITGLVVFYYGVRQALHWWLPLLIGFLSIPLPELITQALALPLQFQASRMGAAMLEMRDIPVRLTGNVIRIPGNELFVTEACSGLRSLTALISLAVLLSGLVLQSVAGRVFLVLFAIPIAVAVNGVRVFLTGFLVYFVDPALGKGFMHITEGWLLFLVSLSCLGLVAWVCTYAERPFFKPVYSDA